MKTRVARRGFDDPEVAVVHFIGVDPVPILDQIARSDLWAHIEPILEGRTRRTDPYAEVKVFRYRDQSGRSMLAIQEWC